MLFMDVPPDVPALHAPVIIAQASQAQEPARTDRTIGVCHLVNSLGVAGRDDPLSPVYVIGPSMTVGYYYSVIEHKDLNYDHDGKVTLLHGPEHGELKVKANGNYRYTPVNDYIGTDRATFVVEIGGRKVKVVYDFKVIDGGAIGGTEEEDKQNCPKGRTWKISTINDANGNLVVTSVDNQSPTIGAGATTTDLVASAYTLSASK